MANEEILQEEESNILSLTDENGQEVEFEYLDSVEYEGKEYLILMPAEEVESGEIVILEVQPVDEETENYLSVGSEKILDAVYAIFKERYKDVLTFEDFRFNSNKYLQVPAFCFCEAGAPPLDQPGILHRVPHRRRAQLAYPHRISWQVQLQNGLHSNLPPQHRPRSLPPEHPCPVRSTDLPVDFWNGVMYR